MPKVNRSNRVLIQNVWGVDTTSSSKSYKVRFRSNESADGWATAFIPKSDQVQVEQTTKRNMYNITASNDDIKVRIRMKTSDSHQENEVPIRGKIGGDPGFKEMYALSRKLVEADKAKSSEQPTTNTNRDIPVIPTEASYDSPFDDIAF